MNALTAIAQVWLVSIPVLIVGGIWVGGTSGNVMAGLGLVDSAAFVLAAAWDASIFFRKH